jgi:hypothetical protein
MSVQSCPITTSKLGGVPSVVVGDTVFIVALNCSPCSLSLIQYFSVNRTFNDDYFFWRTYY